MGVRRLTDQQRRQWRQEGYILVKGALSREQAAAYRAAADEVVERYRAERPKVRQQKAFTIIQTVEQSPAFDSLLDHPGTFGLILDLMGPYIQVMGTQIYVRHPSAAPLSGWHTDAGPSLQQVRVEPDSLPLNLKIQYFLTDIDAEDRANFCVVPGSHRVFFPEGGLGGTEPEGARQICAEAGDAALFPHNLWHGVAPHRGEGVRRSVTLRYGQMWCRPYDYEKAPADVLARMTARQRRLMGDMGPEYTATDYFKPHDQLETILAGLED
ncbi:MAG: hypothetical protein GKR89_01210 [Candidatus Latescibacteria bacterium]|nr:hypothetical protein [Candidatus Latescibacterota bacterium]